MWPQTEKTIHLLNNAQQGDKDAVNALLERHRDALRRMIDMRIDKAIAKRVDASDIVQDVLIEANRRLENYDGSMPFHLWLRHLAKDRIIDMHRKHRGAQKRSVDREASLSPQYHDQSSMQLADQLRDLELTPAAASIRKELEGRFLVAIDQLEEDDREIVLMRHYEQLSNQEVATALEVSPQAASMRLLRALRKLRVILGEHPSLG